MAAGSTQRFVRAGVAYIGEPLLEVGGWSAPPVTICSGWVGAGDTGPDDIGAFDTPEVAEKPAEAVEAGVETSALGEKAGSGIGGRPAATTTGSGGVGSAISALLAAGGSMEMPCPETLGDGRAVTSAGVVS
ncbi:MAG: hypothetical protein WDN27_05510 [Candidatus Saccharibacteria bacterium]